MKVDSVVINSHYLFGNFTLVRLLKHYAQFWGKKVVNFIKYFSFFMFLWQEFFLTATFFFFSHFICFFATLHCWNLLSLIFSYFFVKYSLAYRFLAELWNTNLPFFFYLVLVQCSKLGLPFATIFFASSMYRTWVQSTFFFLEFWDLFFIFFPFWQSFAIFFTCLVSFTPLTFKTINVSWFSSCSCILGYWYWSAHSSYDY